MDHSLPKLPQDWIVCTFEDIAEIKGGKRLPKGKKFSKTPTKYTYLIFSMH